ncbi:MAG TPA: hypothetical protein EYQ24_01850 [Bacteroidetes bacterium]|nr:hypothetical protein [Bacteroidota bacterium]HIL56655.1 hypothetical protein [Rhodothermales bacterium]
MSKLPSAALLLLLAVVPLGCAGDDATMGSVVVHDLRLVRDGTAYPELSGYLVNETTERVASADVGVVLYDDDNLPMSEPARLVVRDVAPGDSARFRKKLDVDARGARVDYIIAN